MPQEEHVAPDERTPSPIADAQPLPIPVTQKLAETADILEREAETKTPQDVADFMEKENFYESAEEVRKDIDLDGLSVYASLSRDDTLQKEFHLKTALDRLRFRVLFKRWLSRSVSKLGQITPNDLAKTFESHQKLKPFSKVDIVLMLLPYFHHFAGNY